MRDLIARWTFATITVCFTAFMWGYTPADEAALDSAIEWTMVWLLMCVVFALNERQRWWKERKRLLGWAAVFGVPLESRWESNAKFRKRVAARIRGMK